MERWRTGLYIAGTVVLAVVVFVKIHALAGQYLHSHHATNAMAAAVCTGAHTTYTVIIHDDVLDQQHIKARLCDALTIINADPVLREMAFGEHERHQTYDGITEKLLDENQSFTVMLNQAGTFKFHDHSHPEVAGDFTVTK